jgi:hypothetical protein
MARATITIKSGAVVSIEGTEAEVAALVARLDAGDSTRASAPRTRTVGGKPTLSALVSALIEEGFFKEPRGLGAVKYELAARGHFYPVTSLSPLMVRLVRKKELRRLKEKKKWVYVR